MNAQCGSGKIGWLLYRIVFGGLIVYSSRGYCADESKVNCGWAATELVLQNYGVFPLSESTQASGTQATFSLEDVRNRFVDAGFLVESYRFRDAPQSMLRRLNDGSCQALLLGPVGLTTRFDSEMPGHYFVVSSWSPDSLQVIDPITVESHTFNSSVFANDSCEAYIQFVTRPFDRLLYAPLRWMDSILLAMIPMGASLVCFVIRPESSVKTIVNDAPLQKGLGR